MLMIIKMSKSSELVEVPLDDDHLVDDILKDKREMDRKVIEKKKKKLNIELKNAKGQDDHVVEIDSRTMETLRDEIYNNYIRPAYIDDVKDAVHGRRLNKKIGDYIELLSQVLFYASMIIAFAAGGFDKAWLGFLSGSIMVGYKAVGGMASYFHNEGKERNETLNGVLAHIGMKKMPDLFTVTNPPGTNQTFVSAVDIDTTGVRDYIKDIVDSEEEV